MTISGTEIAAILTAVTALLGVVGKGAWTVFRHWEQREALKEATRATEAKKMLAAKNRELSTWKRKLADCEKRVASS